MWGQYHGRFCLAGLCRAMFVIASFVDVNYLVSLHRPRCTSDWSIIFGFGMKDKPLDKIQACAADYINNIIITGMFLPMSKWFFGSLVVFPSFYCQSNSLGGPWGGGLGLGSYQPPLGYHG